MTNSRQAIHAQPNMEYCPRMEVSFSGVVIQLLAPFRLGAQLRT